jgi:RTX calcium-binding nonapeptide repeat (4 copies)
MQFRFVLVATAAFALAVSGAAAQTPPVVAGSDHSARVSPNGEWLLYLRSYGGSRYSNPEPSLLIARPDGSGERVLVPRTRHVEASWTPDNLMQVTVGEETTLRRPEDGSVVRRLAFEPGAWSPDGRLVAYVDWSREPRRLYVAAADGSAPRALVTAPRLRGIGVGEFSPDSTRLSYSVGVTLGRERSEVIRVDGSGRTTLKEAQLAGPGNWAPDGTALVLSAQGNPNRPNRYDPGRSYVVDAAGRSARLIAPGSAWAAEWSPRGDWIVYLRQTNTRMRDLWDLMLVRPTGRDRRRVVRTDQSGGSWLADGRRVLAVGAGACWRWGILEVDVFRRTVKRLTNRCGITGTQGDDTLRGTPLRDLISGRGGSDSITGAGGHDRLSGGPGADVILARDRVGDTVICGPGRDRVIADRVDVVARDCERVARR